MPSDFQWTLTEPSQGTLVLANDPIGWDTTSFTLQRSVELNGITRKFSSDVEFFEDGRDFLRTVYDSIGVNAVVVVLIELFNRDTQQYEELFTGKINLQNFEESESNDGLVTIVTNIEETGFERQFMDHIDSDVNMFDLFTLNANEITPFTTEDDSIAMQSQLITRKFDALVTADKSVQAFWLLGQKIAENKDADDDPYAYFVTFGLDDIIDDTVIDVFTSSLGITDDSPITLSTFFLNNREKGSFTIDIDVDFDIRVNLPRDQERVEAALIRGFVVKNNVNPAIPTNILSEVIIQNDPASLPVQDEYLRQNITFSFLDTIELDVNDRLFFYVQVDLNYEAGGALNARVKLDDFTITVNSHTITIDGNTQTDPSTNQGLLMHEAFNRIIESITDQPNKLDSDFFGRTDSEPVSYPVDGKGSLDFLTNGYLIRGADRNTKPIFSSFKSLFNSANIKYNLGVGIIDDIVKIEEIAFFYQSVDVLTITELKDFSSSVADQLYFNRVNIGYDKWETEEDRISGALEFNGKRQFLTPALFIDNPLELTTNYVSASYAIESTRRKRIIDINTADNSRFDEDNFIIRTVRDVGSGFKAATNENITFTTGIVDAASTYNMDLIPGRILRNHFNTIKAALFRMSNILKFVSSEGFDDVSTTDAALGEITENENAIVTDTALYDPIIYRFNAAVTFTDVKAILTNIYGRIVFTDPIDKVQRKGFIISMAYNFNERQADFELLKAV